MPLLDCSPPYRSMASPEPYTVVDVYEIAASIGKDFETIIDAHGADSISDLMQKVISILEQLEIMSTNLNKDTGELDELRYTVSRLRTDKESKASERARFEQELEQIEESWHKETKELVEQVTKLQEENRKLKTSLEENRSLSDRESDDEDGQLMNKLKATVDAQRQEIRLLKKDSLQKNTDLEAIQSQVERLTTLNSDLRRKASVSQLQHRSFIQEKAELEASLHDRDQLIIRMKGQLRLHENKEPHSPDLELSLKQLEEKLTIHGKMVIDLHDPERPRFTLKELREVLQERNEMKSKLLDVEEELKMYRPKKTASCGVGDDNVFGEEVEEDLPVQGPINREPWEKLNPDEARESGVRKLFSRFMEKLNIDPNDPPNLKDLQL